MEEARQTRATALARLGPAAWEVEGPALLRVPKAPASVCDWQAKEATGSC